MLFSLINRKKNLRKKNHLATVYPKKNLVPKDAQCSETDFCLFFCNF